MNKARLTTPKAYVTYFIIALGMLGIVSVRYFESFTTVTFHYDTTLGTVKLSTDSSTTLTPPDNSALRLKKGTYTVTAQGKNVAKNPYNLTIDGSKKDYTINFIYTDSYLAERYKNEQLAIYTELLLAYPKINSDYTIRHDRLYNQGQWFGATLLYNDQTADNRDTLHVVMKKTGDNWQVVSRPPSPILSTKDYPNVPYATLKAINQGE